LTPPVMLSVYAASTLAHSGLWKTAGVGMRLGIAAYIVPFAFVYNTALLAEGPALQIAISAIAAILGVGMLAIGLEGYLTKNLGWVERALLIAGGVALLTPFKLAWIAGAGLAAVLFFWERIGVKHSSQSHPQDSI